MNKEIDSLDLKLHTGLSDTLSDFTLNYERKKIKLNPIRSVYVQMIIYESEAIVDDETLKHLSTTWI